MPQLSDLRESGAIEQDADMVMFLYRPEYYGINNDEMGETIEGETHIHIAKNRSGSTDTIKHIVDGQVIPYLISMLGEAQADVIAIARRLSDR